MEHIKETVRAVFKGWHDKDKQGPSDEVAVVLKKVLAKKALEHVKLYNFRKGVLSIRVDSSTWLYYLNLQKEDILSKVRKGCAPVKDIRFSLGD